MFKSHLTAIILAATAISSLPSSADAWLWGLFGKDEDKWRMMEPAQQDVEAQKIMESAQTALQAHNDKKAIKLFNKIYFDFPASKYTADALFNVGKINMRLQKWNKAYSAYSALINAYPENTHFDEMVDDLVEIAYAYETGKNIHYCRIFPYKDRNKAILIYESVVAVAPYSDYAPACLMRIAMLHYEMHELVPAVTGVDRIINDYPNSLEAPNATLFIANLMSEQVDGPAYDQGATNEAINYYRDFMTLYPTNPAVNYCEEKLEWNKDRYAQSRLMIGEFFYKYRDDYDSAAVFFNDCITNAPNSDTSVRARDYLDKIAKIKDRFPNGDWPRRTEWQFMRFWHKWDPLTEPVVKPKAEKKATSDEKKNDKSPEITPKVS